MTRFSTALAAALIALPYSIPTFADFEPPIVLRNVKLVQPGGAEPQIVDIVMREGRFEFVGPHAAVPRGAEIIDGSMLTAYPGLIDAATPRGFINDETAVDQRRLDEDEPQDAVQGPLSRTSIAYRRLVHPQWKAAERYDPGAADQNAHRKAGFTTANITPPRAVIAGYGAVMQLGDEPRRRSILRADGPLYFSLEPGGAGFGGEYPTTIAGAIALFRQTLLDARWRMQMREWAGKDTTRLREVPVDRSLAALEPMLSQAAVGVFYANGADAIHRALDIAEEAGIANPVILGGEEAWKLASRLKTQQTRLVLSLSLPTEPKMPDGMKEKHFGLFPATQPATATSSAPSSRAFDDTPFGEDWERQPFEPKRVYDERKRLWNEYVNNAAVLHRAGVAFAFSTLDCKSPEEAMANLRKMIEGGLPANVAVEALTTVPAKMLGVEQQVGVVASGRVANLVVMTAPLTDKNSRVRWVFIDGKKFEFEVKPPASQPEGEGGEGGRPRGMRGRRRGGRPPMDEAMTAGALGEEHAAVQVPKAPSRSIRLGGASASKPMEPIASTASAETSSATSPSTSSAPASRPAIFPEWASEIEADRKPALHTGGNVLIKHVNVVMVNDGIKTDSDVLVRDGKIIAVGPNLATSKDVLIIDLPGYYVSPGIIDCHSHMALAGGLNEGSQSVTPEVRIGDVVRHDDESLYQATAGGVTMIHTMHGSANTIGGQNVVLRLKWGRPASEMRVPEAHRTIKFALGENVKRSNGGQANRTRFPTSRMGVEATLRRSFAEATRYRAALRQFETDKQAGRQTKPVRRDLRLEALSDIMDGAIWVHSHCYRSDEILRLLDVAEDYGFRIAVLQHVLEGYRIIPEMYRHGCAASTFSDWWTYKLEAADAVPHNAARMEQGGVVATVNSDSAEVVRHMNLEAAKCVRFGGLSETEAMRLCTLNGAISLGLDEQCGSVTPGKWADLAIFDGHPLDTFAKCMMTLVGGEVYFQHGDLAPRRPLPPARPALVIPAPRAILSIPASKSGVYALRGATIHPVSGPDVVDGAILFSEDGIRAVGASAEVPIPLDAEVIDGRGLEVWPGLINARTSLGLSEIGSVPGSIDTAELGTFQPDMIAGSAVHPHSDLIPVTRAEGVTTALVCPDGGIVAGRSSFIRLTGWTAAEMMVRREGPLVLNLPSLPPELPEEGREQRLREHREQWKRIDEFLRKSKLYADVESRPSEVDTDDRFEAMRPYITGQLPVIVNADSVKQILEAIKFARRYEMKLIVSGARESWKVADLLAKEQVPVILDNPMDLPGEFEPWNSIYRCAGVLDRAGVAFCFGGGQASLAKQVATNAGMAVAHGLPADRALYALTLGAAKILNVSDKRGSIEVGKAADLIVTNGHPCQATTRVLAVFIDGRPMDMSSKHTRLDDKFVHRPPPTLPPERRDLNGPPPLRVRTP